MPATGRRAPSGSHTQSVVFAKAQWTAGKARKWLQEHKYVAGAVDETENTLRYRQYDPDEQRHRYRNKEAGQGITLVLGFPRSSAAESAEVVDTKGGPGVETLIEGTTVQDVQEHVGFDPQGVVWDKAAMVVRNVKVFGYDSRNNREYTPRAAGSLCRLAEGAQSFIDHPPPEKASDNRELKHGELLGCTRNLRRDDARREVRGDLHYMRRHEDLIEFLVTQNVANIGFSTNGAGALRGRGASEKTLVEDYVRHNSIDLVVNPGTVRSLRESVEVTPPPGDLPASPSEGVTDAMEQEQLNQLLEQNKTLQQQNKELLEAVRAEKAARESAEQKAAHQRIVQEALDSCGKALCDEDKVTVRRVLERCADKAEMLDLLKTVREKAAAKAPETAPAKAPLQERAPMATEATEPTTSSKPTKDAAAKAMSARLLEATQDLPPVHPGAKVLATTKVR